VAPLSTYAGLFLVAMATLMYEVLLTRIFSVTTWYHFAFLSISVTLFGLAAGGIAVYLNSPNFFTQEKTHDHMAASSLLFAVFSSAAILVHLFCPFLLGDASAGLIITVALSVTIPFTLAAFTASGIAISLALTRFPRQVNYLYAADLLGAGLGCLAVVGALRYIDALTGVFLISALACISALCFAQTRSKTRIFSTAIAFSVGFAAIAAAQFLSYQAQQPLVAVRFTKGLKEPENLYQLWNTFSRIRVFGSGNENNAVDPYGLSPKIAETTKAKFLYLDIDGGAATPILKFDGNTDPVSYLAYEISNVVHHLRKNAEVAVIGAGGGKDILSALVMNQKHVTAIEINENVLKAVHEKYAEFSGNLKSDPRITLVNDEARSYITRTDKKFDIIQISMIDTWAATASGAYALSENGLYTTEAIKTLVNHLTENGVLTISRWYAHGIPSEFYRLTALAAESLKQLGITNPEQHIMAFRVMPTKERSIPDGIGTLLISKSPFSAQDYEVAKKHAADMQFELVFAGDVKNDATLARLAAGEDPATAAASVPFNLKPPTDDSPFFFQAISLKHLADPQAMTKNMNLMNMFAGLMLLIAGIFTLVVTVYCIRIPYLKTTDKPSVIKAAPLFVYFFSIGAGFMFIEISQIERLTIFLGHPVYGLSVVLFALLLSTGIGSLLSEHWLIRRKLDPKIAVSTIIAVLLVYFLASVPVLTALDTQPLVVRVGAAIALLSVIGLMLGTAFPIGINTTMRLNPSLAPWLWGINGASSVSASVLAIIVAMFIGINASFLCGVTFYVAALLALKAVSKNIKD
jgi:spermidine synthase